MPSYQTKHPGFTAVSNRIASREDISANRARAILASATRRASKRAKTKNPKLRKVKG